MLFVGGSVVDSRLPDRFSFWLATVVIYHITGYQPVKPIRLYSTGPRIDRVGKRLEVGKLLFDLIKNPSSRYIYIYI